MINFFFGNYGYIDATFSTGIKNHALPSSKTPYEIDTLSIVFEKFRCSQNTCILFFFENIYFDPETFESKIIDQNHIIIKEKEMGMSSGKTLEPLICDEHGGETEYLLFSKKANCFTLEVTYYKRGLRARENMKKYELGYIKFLQICIEGNLVLREEENICALGCGPLFQPEIIGLLPTQVYIGFKEENLMISAGFDSPWVKGYEFFTTNIIHWSKIFSDEPEIAKLVMSFLPIITINECSVFMKNWKYNGSIKMDVIEVRESTSNFEIVMPEVLAPSRADELRRQIKSGRDVAGNEEKKILQFKITTERESTTNLWF